MHVQINLFGEFELLHDGAPVVVKGHKNQSLIAWLAASTDRAHPRDRLAGLLWGDHSQGNARTSLRQALTAIRRVLPDDAVALQTDSISLLSTAVDVDVLEFARLVRLTDTESWWQAIQVYDGDLLDGFRSKSEPFDDWLLLERESYRRQAMEIMQSLLADEGFAADSERVIQVCAKLLVADPLAEHVHRRLMTLYAQRGQTGLALRQFRICEEVLQRELSSPPSVETVQLMRSLKGGELEDVPAATQNSSVSPSSHQPIGNVDRAPVLPCIAVLPFISMSSDAEHGYLADGMTEELINALANCTNWRVLARNTSFKYKDKNIDVRDLGIQLGVSYVVEGSIRRVADRIRVTVQLIDTNDGAHIWSDRYDRPLDAIFDVQDEVVQAIFMTLKNKIGFAVRERVRRSPKANLDAWGLLMKANQVRVTDGRTRDEQRDLIREALSIDPHYPRAHAYLASALFVSIGRGYSANVKQDYAEAKQHADTALATGEADLVVLKMCAAGYAAAGNAKRALQLAERAFELSQTPDPLLVAVLMWNGRLADAQHHCQTVVDSLVPGLPTPPGELRPVSLLGNLYMLSGNYEQAMQFAERDVRANPSNYFSHINLANVQGLVGDVEAAQTSWSKAVELSPGLTLASFDLGYQSVMVDSELADRFSAGLQMVGIE